MVTRMPITKARINFGAVVKRVNLKNDRVILEKDGYPVAIIVSIQELEKIIGKKVSRHGKDAQ